MQPVSESFFETAPHIYRYVVDLPVPPERVWESLQSDNSLADWGPAIKSVKWTTPRPFGVGAEREVSLPLGALKVREHFFVWDEGKRYSFYVTAANVPIFKHLAEDYVLEPTATGTRFTWTVALEAKPKTKLLVKINSPLNKLLFGRIAASGKSYFRKHP